MNPRESSTFIKSVEKTIWETQLRLLAPSVTEEFLRNARTYLTPSHYRDIVLERSIGGTCGYPRCRNNLPVLENRRKMQKEAIELDEASKFCSPDCLHLSNTFSNSLSEEAVHLRPEITVSMATQDDTQSRIIGVVTEHSQESDEEVFDVAADVPSNDPTIKLWTTLSALVTTRTLAWWTDEHDEATMDTPFARLLDTAVTDLLLKLGINGDLPSLRPSLYSISATLNTSTVTVPSRDTMDMYALSLMKLLNDHHMWGLDLNDIIDKRGRNAIDSCCNLFKET